MFAWHLRSWGAHVQLYNPYAIVVCLWLVLLCFRFIVYQRVVPLTCFIRVWHMLQMVSSTRSCPVNYPVQVFLSAGILDWASFAMSCQHPQSEICLELDDHLALNLFWPTMLFYLIFQQPFLGKWLPIVTTEVNLLTSYATRAVHHSTYEFHVGNSLCVI